MKSLIRILSIAVALLTTACSQIELAVVNLPTYFNSINITRNVAFGPDAWQTLDIYRPKGTTKDSRLPVIVFYYGGRWEFGAKEDFRFVGAALAKQNYLVVIPDYRKYPNVKFPAFVQDAAKSLAWVSDHIAAYGGKPDDIHIAGHSAGGHIGALLTTDARYLKAEGKDRSDVIRDFVGLAGPYDFVPDEKDLKDMFAPPSNYSQMQATTFVDGKQPPMLLLWGDKDQYVGRINMDKLAAGIYARGGCVKTIVYPGLDHVWIIGGLSWLGSKHSVLKDWMDFIQSECAPK